MEILLFILISVVLVVLLNVRSSIADKLNTLQHKVDKLTEELKKIKGWDKQLEDKKSILEEISLAHKKPEVQPEPVKSIVEPRVVEAEKKIEEAKKEAENEFKKQVEQLTAPEIKPVTVQAPVNKPPFESKPGFFERNPDLEKFIGENLANKIGIGVLVLGIGFFVKYAIDKEWINEIGRVFIGILSGGILLGIAHYLRKKFAAFSSVLVGGGIAVLYLTIAIAFHEYQLFSQTAAFILTLVITSFSVVFSIGYNRIELAILAILGGFASPFMVSTGEGNYIVLFTYILVLDVGMLVLAYYKKWNLVNIVSYVFTLILFGSWLNANFESTQPSMIAGALIYATLFYFVFFGMNVINNIKERTTFEAMEFTMLISNTFLYYAAGMFILNNDITHDFRGLFTALLGVFNFIFAFALYKNQRVDKNLVFLLIGLVLTFISLAAPVQLEGNYITLFWAAEAVLLFWLSQKSGIRLMKLGSVIVMSLMIISLLMDWNQIYYGYLENKLNIILNKGYITSIIALVSVTITYFLLKKETQEKSESVQLYRTMLTWFGTILLYASQLLELRYQLGESGLSYSTQTVIIGTYNMLFMLGLLLTERKLSLHAEVKKAFSFWGIMAMVAYLIYYHNITVSARDGFLLYNEEATGFIFHYVLIIILIAVAFLSLPKIQALTEFNKSTLNLYSWFYVFFFVFLASAELDHTVLMIAGATTDSQYHILTQNHKIGFPILWGITSFLLIAIGLKTKKKHLRIISLTLFLVTLIKLFLVDIRGISEGGKIAAFISLGVLLLVVSFMYQRLKKLLLEDNPSDSSQQEKS